MKANPECIGRVVRFAVLAFAAAAAVAGMLSK